MTHCDGSLAGIRHACRLLEGDQNICCVCLGCVCCASACFMFLQTCSQSHIITYFFLNLPITSLFAGPKKWCQSGFKKGPLECKAGILLQPLLPLLPQGESRGVMVASRKTDPGALRCETLTISVHVETCCLALEKSERKFQTGQIHNGIKCVH